MTRRWMTVLVELVNGRGVRYDPGPGRILILPPATTFHNLGLAIDHAFARWDLSHLRTFTLEDNTLICDGELANEITNGFDGTIPRTRELTTKVSSTVSAGARFAYTYDLGDEWTHLCTVTGTADPLDAAGIVPDVPIPICGWGDIPDQYGRRWQGDNGDDEGRPQERAPDPLVDRWLGPPPTPPTIDLRLLRAAYHSRDLPRILDAVAEVDLSTALQQVGALVLSRYVQTSPADEPQLASVLLAVYNRLGARGWAGDALLAQDILDTLRGEGNELRRVPLDLEVLELVLTSGNMEHPGGYLNTVDGRVLPAMLAHRDDDGYPERYDIDGPDWHYLEQLGSRIQWRHMRDFVDSVEDAALRQRLGRALEGKGAFRRFRDELRRTGDAEMLTRWNQEQTDRIWGEARERLAMLGIRPLHEPGPALGG